MHIQINASIAIEL